MGEIRKTMRKREAPDMLIGDINGVPSVKLFHGQK